jgi:hypothetical protein
MCRVGYGSPITTYTQRSVISSDNAIFPYRIFKRYRTEQNRTEQVLGNNTLCKTAWKYSMCKLPARKNIYWWTKYQMNQTKVSQLGQWKTNRFTGWRRSGVVTCFIGHLLSLHKLCGVDWEMTGHITNGGKVQLLSPTAMLRPNWTGLCNGTF